MPILFVSGERKMAELSPMMKQYFKIKKEYSDTILMFRLGDFYEMFYKDAEIVSKELELVLTGRDCGQEERAPMCGVPFHSAENYIARLVSRGYKVAICEQTEDPATAKGIVKRDVIRVITPGTALNSNMLDEGMNNYLASVYYSGDDIGIAFCDVSTGVLETTEFSGNEEAEIINELSKYHPREIILNTECFKFSKLKAYLSERLECIVNSLDEESFKSDECTAEILTHFKKKNLAELGLDNKISSVKAVGAIFSYLEETQKTKITGITDLGVYESNQYVRLDSNTRRNLELTETMRSKEKRGSVLWVIDKTKTAMGKRMLRAWLENPLINSVEINKRLNAVEELNNDIIKRSEIREALSSVLDLERIMTRIIYKTATARELRALHQALSNVPALKTQLNLCKSELLRQACGQMDLLEDVVSLIDSAVVEQPPLTIRDGGMIKEGFNSELDELNGIMKNSKAYLEEIEAREQKKTGIKKLRIGYNKVYGYYIEVTNSFKDLVPDEYIRKQTLTNAERYITQELKELESKILGAKERAVQMESELFAMLRNRIADEFERIQKTARSIAFVDVIQSLAQVAEENNFVRPDVDEGDEIIIKDGRHPVVEKMMTDSPFVPNDTILDCRDNRVAVITGPNMAGKSTFMRQTALITVLAQIGSFVPASKAKIGVVDAIFTRVGASDDLTSGQSTFMMEMNEVAEILKNATSKSLIVYDEIGRGTSTFDGMSIAKAVLEFTADKKKIGAKTLFATHYHELTAMEKECSGIKNYNIAVKKKGGEIIFLRRIVPGGTDDSYGIDVAKLAGVPIPVIERAKQVLAELESGKAENTEVHTVKEEYESQISFGFREESAILDKLRNVDVNTLTPIEAMSLLFELSQKAKNTTEVHLTESTRKR